MTKARSQNYDLIRLLAAIGVVFSHSFLIAEGTEVNEPFLASTGRILGIYSVHLFFILSGFLITRSRIYSKSSLTYLWKRFLRIYPAYAASIIGVVLLICPFFTENGYVQYISSAETWSSVIKCLLFINAGQDDALIISGVSFYDQVGVRAIGPIINGVFWSIKIELLLYLVVAVLYSFKCLNQWVVGGLCLIMTFALLTDFYIGHYSLWGLTIGMPGFFAGSFLHFYFEKRIPNRTLALLFMALTVISLQLGYAWFTFPILAAYPVIWLGASTAPQFAGWMRFGDLSYGVYVIGWPIQQVVRNQLGAGWSGYGLFFVCLPFVLFAAFLSWHLVEKQALRFKNKFAQLSVNAAPTDTIESSVTEHAEVRQP